MRSSNKSTKNTWFACSSAVQSLTGSSMEWRRLNIIFKENVWNGTTFIQRKVIWAFAFVFPKNGITVEIVSWIKSHKIFIWSFLLLCWRDYPQDLICHLYFIEKRDRFKAITLFCSSISIHSFLLEVSSNLLEIPVALFPLSGFWFYGLAKISASTEIDAPQWHFLKKASKQSKARLREDQLYSTQDKTPEFVWEPS